MTMNYAITLHMFIQLSAVATASTLISACANLIARSAHPIIENTTIPVWGVDVSSPRHPFSGVWTTRLGTSDAPVSGNLASTPNKYLHIQEKNWNLAFYTLPDRPESGNENPGASEADSADWERDVKLTYQLAAYMFGTDPLPVDADIYLVPKTDRFSHKWASSAPDAVPVRYAFVYDVKPPENKSAADGAMKQRWEGLANLGYLLQKFEMANGVTAGPADPHARVLKAEANSLCSLLALRPALAAGTDLRVKSGARLPPTTLPVLKANYDNHPDSAVALKMYVGALLFREAQAYMDHAHENWPAKGTNKSGLNAALRFCRALVHYPGSIETTHMPFELVDKEPIFFE